MEDLQVTTLKGTDTVVKATAIEAFRTRLRGELLRPADAGYETARLDDELIAATVEYARQVPSPLSVIMFAELHGAYSRVGKTDTAYYHRDLQYDPIALSVWTDPAETPRHIRWARELFAAWEPHLPRAVYVNDLGDEGEERARSAYSENYERLVALKTRYDPTNVFRLNQNIKPGM